MAIVRVKIEGIDAVKASLASRARQVRAAASGAINDVAFTAREEINRQMQAKFRGGATPYSLRAFRVEKSTPETLTATVSLREDGPGKGTPYNKALAHLFTGGDRRWKRMEGAFRGIGVLPAGQMMTVPRDSSWANPLDSYGNPKPSFIVQLIAYFNGFGEQGYRANMTDKRRKSLAKIGKSAGGYKTINGVQYFISRGRGMWFGREQHLAAGIWARRGTHGVVIAPVFLFVRKANYRQVIDLEKLGEGIVRRWWPRQFDRWLAFKTGAR